jgi:acyl carrier protein
VTAREDAIEALVLDTAAAVTRLDRHTLGPRTSLLDAQLDSLTLITLVTYVELALRVSFSEDELLGLLGATDFGELSQRIARSVAAARCNESAQKAEILELRAPAKKD